jgi:hypothetical protein
MSAALGGGGLTSSFLLGFLLDRGAGRPGGRVALPSAWVQCEGDNHSKPISVAAPACLEGGDNCSSTPDHKKLQEFAKAVDDGLEDDLKEIKNARQTFLRRACDYRYAEIEDKGELLQNTYGPRGPLLPGGSYLFEMRRWADAAFMLHRSCNRGMGGCQSLIDYLKEHPEDDIGPGGAHGKVGSKIYDELRLACEVGKTRSPVPNDGPAWCHVDTGLCEQKSCKRWWRRAHGSKSEPWVDDRVEYDALKEACSWIEKSRPTSRDLNKYQKKVEESAIQEQIDFCRPKWVEGYCSNTKDVPRFGQCTLSDGKWCKNGRIFSSDSGGSSNLNDTGRWEEPFKESPVSVENGSMPPLLLLGRLPMPSELATAARGTFAVQVKRPATSRYHSFL